MIIDFQQGIITYPISAGQQVFLAKIGSYVSLQTANGRTDVTFAHGSENYLYTESSDVQTAWGPLAPNTDYWIYWDIDLLTAARTFGFTTVEPISSPTEPTPELDLHWFDSDARMMYVRRLDGRWHNVIRVFAAKVHNSTFTEMGQGDLIKPFAGTQAQLNTPDQVTGRITVDNTGTPIRRSTGLFFTTEDDFFINGSPASTIKLESNIVNGTALENIARYQVVKFTHFGQINLANYNDTQTTIIAMAMEDILYNHPGELCVQGVVTNPSWNFDTVGAALWIADTGLLTEIDPHVSDVLYHIDAKVPVARVLSQTSILFDQGMGGVGSKGDTGNGYPPPATTTFLGLVKISVSATDPLNPIAVETNDPRLLPYIHPATHPATMITADSYGILSGLTVQTQLHQLSDRTLDSISDVLAPSPSINDFLKWNGSDWVSGKQNLDDLLDVMVPAPSLDDYLMWNGSNWVNNPLYLNKVLDVHVTDPVVNNYLRWDGDNWVNDPGLTSLPYDIAYYISATPYDIDTIVTGFLSPRSVVITSASNNIAKCSTAATTVDTTFILKQNGVQKATILFNIGSLTGTITFTAGSTITVVSGDVLTICTSSTLDTVIAGIGITFVGDSAIA